MVKPLSILVAVGTLAVGGTSRAADQEDAQGARAEAVRIAKQAAAAYKAENYPLALAKFRRAYETFPAAPLLSNLSHVELKLGDCASALDYAHRFAASSTEAPAAEEWIHRVESECPEAEITTDPAGASLRIDTDQGPPAGATPWKGRLLAGQHTLLFQAAGFSDRREVVSITAGAAFRFDQPLMRPPPMDEPPPPLPAEVLAIPAPPSAPVAARPAPGPVTPSSRAQPRPSINLTHLPEKAPPPVAATATKPGASPIVRAIGWSGLAAGGAALVAGLAVGLGARSDTTALGKVSTSRTGAQAQQQITSINARATGANVLFGAGGALAATGVGLVIAF